MEVKQVTNLQTTQQLNSQTAVSSSKIQKVRSQQQVKNEQNLREKNKVSMEQIEKVIEELKKKLSMLNTQLQIKIDKDTDITVIKVIDKQTNKVIRQIPPEYVLKIAKYLDEIAGILLNEKA